MLASEKTVNVSLNIPLRRAMAELRRALAVVSDDDGVFLKKNDML
jgi:hypothetical protein